MMDEVVDILSNAKKVSKNHEMDEVFGILSDAKEASKRVKVLPPPSTPTSKPFKLEMQGEADSVEGVILNIIKKRYAKFQENYDHEMHYVYAEGSDIPFGDEPTEGSIKCCEQEFEANVDAEDMTDWVMEDDNFINLITKLTERKLGEFNI